MDRNEKMTPEDKSKGLKAVELSDDELGQVSGGVGAMSASEIQKWTRIGGYILDNGGSKISLLNDLVAEIQAGNWEKVKLLALSYPAKTVSLVLTALNSIS